jgi:hypothetical protein
MKTFTFTSPTIIVLALTMSASPAHAQVASAVPAGDATTLPTIEVTPFVSIDSRGSTPIGAAVSFPRGSSFSLETEVGYRGWPCPIRCADRFAGRLRDWHAAQGRVRSQATADRGHSSRNASTGSTRAARRAGR